MREDYLSLAEAEQFVGGDVEERREQICRAGARRKLRWAREFALDNDLPAGLFVQPARWVLEKPDWEHSRLTGTPAGFELRISRKDLVDCGLAPGRTRKKPISRQCSEPKVARWVRDDYAPLFKGLPPPNRDEFEAALQHQFDGMVPRKLSRDLKNKYLRGRAGRPKSGAR